MAILKCKMCGDNIEVSQDKTYGTCESCGSTMTLPKIDSDQRANLFNRANRFRQIGEFDKAISAYESILNQDDTDAEAHWCVVLSRFGIEYVIDPASGKRIPTCHRLQTSPILVDADYLAALEHTTDAYTKELYQQEANRIAEIQKDIMAISASEAPYDIFICYKESDENGNRTKDSAMAQEVYYQLTNEGFKVFFARISLEDKLGTAYEPYIFAALHSAKAMIVVGSKSEHFNAIWVKNEWSRYLDLMSKDKTRLLIPCYRDMDAYDIPDALSLYQSQDMGKIGFVQDLVRGIKKLFTETKQVAEAPNYENMAPNTAAMLERAFICLEDGDFEKANSILDSILNSNPRSAYAYLGLLMVERKCHLEVELEACIEPLAYSKSYSHILEYSDNELCARAAGYNSKIINRTLEGVRADISNTQKRIEEKRSEADQLLISKNQKELEVERKQDLFKKWESKNGICNTTYIIIFILVFAMAVKSVDYDTSAFVFISLICIISIIVCQIVRAIARYPDEKLGEINQDIDYIRRQIDNIRRQIDNIDEEVKSDTATLKTLNKKHDKFKIDLGNMEVNLVNTSKS